MGLTSQSDRQKHSPRNSGIFMNVRSHPEIYDSIGGGYNKFRIPDIRLAKLIRNALGNIRTVCNVGAGTGAYEPPDLVVTPVEPSERMIAQRPDADCVVRATAEKLPFADGQFDAAMAILTIHHWVDPVRGLQEMQRVSRRQVILTFDPELIDLLWLVRDYLPEIADFEKSRATPMATIVAALGECTATPVLIPWDCTDGFQAAYWRRPDRYLDPQVRQAISSLSKLPENTVSAAIGKLAADIQSGVWATRYADLLVREQLDLGYRLVVANKS